MASLELASSPGRFSANITTGENTPGIDCKRMRTILAQIKLRNTKGTRLVIYSVHLYRNPRI